MEYGYIKLWRNLLDWKWKHSPEMVAVWVHILLTVNFQDGKDGLKAGQVRISRKALAEGTGLSERTLRTCIDRLIEDGSLAKDSSRQGAVYTVINWPERQKRDMDKPSNENEAENRPTGNYCESIEKQSFFFGEVEETDQRLSKTTNVSTNENGKNGHQFDQRKNDTEPLKNNDFFEQQQDKPTNVSTNDTQKNDQQNDPFLNKDIKKDKKKGGIYTRATSPLPLPVIDAMQKAKLAITPSAKEKANEWLEQYGEEQTIAAIERAIDHADERGVSPAYVAAILRNENWQKGRQEEKILYPVPRIRGGEFVSQPEKAESLYKIPFISGGKIVDWR